MDGERIPGTWRPIFIRNGDYHLTELFIYADGAISCWDWVDLEGLRGKLESGWVATELPEGARASVTHLASWRFAEPQSWVDPEELLGEVADEIDRLNDRPDSTGRCQAALEDYLRDRTEAALVALRAAYLAIPAHLRLYVLGDQDAKDWPLRVLAGETGEPVTDEERASALAYFADRRRAATRWSDSRPVDGPAVAAHPTTRLVVVPGRFPGPPDVSCLRNEYPVPITIGGAEHASAEHAYWHLATTDESARAAIREARSALGVPGALGRAPLRPDWPLMRAAAMHAVLRAKFTRHPDLAAVLLATGDGRIDYGIASPYWSGGAEGRNWLGRLLELVRSELAAAAAGLDPRAF